MGVSRRELLFAEIRSDLGLCVSKYNNINNNNNIMEDGGKRCSACCVRSNLTRSRQNDTKTKQKK